MEINSKIKNKVRDSNWRIGPYRNGSSPNDTYGEIVNDSFEEAKRAGRCATHCTLSEMYNPSLGGLRTSKSYSALAPTYGISSLDRHVAPDLRPYRIYTPKRGEWTVLKGHPSGYHRFQPAVHVVSVPNLPLPPISRRQYSVPADTTRFENFSRYWNGRAKGLDLSQPFLYDVRRDNYGITEDRRYQRLYWASRFIPSQPTPRHARQIILTAY